MKQTTKNILGVGAVVLLSAGVAGVTTYTMLKPETETACRSANSSARIPMPAWLLMTPLMHSLWI